PRTDARVLSTAIANEISKNLSGISNSYDSECAAIAGNILKSGVHTNIVNTRYTDDSKVTDHYAIIPAGLGYNSYSSLTEQEKDVYDLIIRRFLSIVLPTAEYSVIKMIEDAEGEKFFASGKILSSPAYLSVAGIPKNDQEASVAAFDCFIEG